MAKTIICSVGTSAAKNLDVPPWKLAEWVQNHENIDSATTEMFETFRDLDPTDESNLTQKLSAEIHSLVRMEIDTSDRVLLLASETDDGECCARSVAKYLERYWPGIYTKVEPIPGLQVTDADRFRNTGVVNFVQRVTREIRDYGNVVLNPTGGFKALVPYTVLLGMLKGVTCDYIFERSTALLELPPLPVEFKRSQFEAYKEIFETIERECFIPHSRWEQDVPYQERLLLEPLIEKSSEGITLSAIGFLFLDEMKSPSALVPFLSQQAIRDCFETLSKLDNCDPFQYLQRVCRSEEVLNNAKHIKSDETTWLKPGNTKDRYLVSVEGWRLLVWRGISKNNEGDDYPNKVKVNPATDRRKYAPFMRLDFVN